MLLNWYNPILKYLPHSDLEISSDDSFFWLFALCPELAYCQHWLHFLRAAESRIDLSSIGGIMYIKNDTPDCVHQEFEGGSLTVWFN